MERPTRRAIQVVALIALSLTLGVIGIRWGVPSAARNRLYFSDGRPWAPPQPVPEDMVRRSAEHFPEFKRVKDVSAQYPRSVFNPLRSYHPDEYYVLKGLANLDPWRLDLKTGLYAWPNMIFYLVGVPLQVASWVGQVRLTHNLTHYYAHPEDLARMYVIGRGVVVVFSVLTVLMVYLAGRSLYEHAVGFLAASLLAVTPAFVIYQHYLTADIVAMFFVAAFLYCVGQVLATQATGWHVLAGVALGLAASTKYQAIVLLPLLPLAQYLGVRPGRPAGRALVKCFTRPMLVGLVLPFLVFIVLNPFHLLSLKEFGRVFTGERASVSTVGWSFDARVREAIGLPAKMLSEGFGYWPLILAVAGSLFALFGQVRRDLLLFTGLAIVYIVMGGIGTIYVRHLFPLFPMLVLLASRAVFICADGLRLRPRQQWIVTAVCALLLCPSLYRSVAHIRLFADESVRIEAGQWIAKNIPAGATIGLPDDNWQYDVPPLDEKRYQLIVTGYSARNLKADHPDYVLTNSRQRDPVLVPRTTECEAFWNYLSLSREYVLADEFRKSPYVFKRGWRPPLRWRSLFSLAGLDPSNEDAPEDLRYVNPILYVHRWRGSESEKTGRGVR